MVSFSDSIELAMDGEPLVLPYQCSSESLA
jgi:hypothetical protein